MSDYDKALIAIRAWKAGASSRAMDPKCTEHADESVRTLYNDYYRQGQQASRQMSAEVQERFNVKFSILRAQ